MNRLLILLLVSVCSFQIHAQDLSLEGYWEGTIAIGGIESDQGYKMEMYIEKQGKKISGRTFIYVNRDHIIEANLSGRMYDDLSIYIDEINFVAGQEDHYIPPFLRKYQLSWKRSLSGSTLNGYWQEIRSDAFHKNRQRGRLFLKKVSDYKA